MKLRVLLIDDEPLGRERLRGLLATEMDIEIIGECGDGPSAVAAARKLKPDVLFLDIQMPGMDGFDVLQALGTKRLPAVVFVTAYDEHALRAFDARALDYLLKPASRTRLRQALERVRAQLASVRPGDGETALRDLLASRPRRIAVRAGERIVYVPVSEIDWVEAAGNYVILHAGTQNHIIRETLGAVENQLSPDLFLRLSRSAIANLGRVKEIQAVAPGEHVAILHTGQRLAITRSLREVEERLRFA
jgi:two-component system LytT family response regulator